jgi:uncharacterized protein
MNRRKLSRKDVLQILEAELPYLSERFGVVRLALYGSFARGDFRSDSDVDLLVELSRPLGLEFVALADYLEEKLSRKVDLATFDAFHRAILEPHRELLAESIQEDMTDVPAPTR